MVNTVITVSAAVFTFFAVTLTYFEVVRFAKTYTLSQHYFIICFLWVLVGVLIALGQIT